MRVGAESTSATRDALIGSAVELFARQGIAETPISEIEAAAGAATGAFGEHFPSKEALLVAAVERHVEMIDHVAVLMDGAEFEVDLETELAFLARWVIAEHRHEEPLLAILQRDGERFPELRELVGDKIVERGYRQGEAWLRRKIAAGGFPDYDAEAVIVVALGSLVAYAAQEKMLGAPPLGVDEDRFVATWVEAWLRVASTAEEERAET